MTADRLRQEAMQRLRALSPAHLRLANRFLAMLKEDEEDATDELRRIPDFARAMEKAEASIAAGRVTNWRKVRRSV